DSGQREGALIHDLEAVAAPAATPVAVNADAAPARISTRRGGRGGRGGLRRLGARPGHPAQIRSADAAKTRGARKIVSTFRTVHRVSFRCIYSMGSWRFRRRRYCNPKQFN